MRGRSGGFSLLELITVMAIAAILASIAFPSFQYLTSTTKIKSASTELYLALIRARSEAVKRNRQVSLSRNGASWSAGWQVIADSNNDGSFNSSDLVVNTGNELNRVTITETSNLTSVVFAPSGRISGTSPNFDVQSQDATSLRRCISADLTGKPYISQAACP